jgi:hypothetical protein
MGMSRTGVAEVEIEPFVEFQMVAGCPQLWRIFRPGRIHRRRSEPGDPFQRYRVWLFANPMITRVGG